MVVLWGMDDSRGIGRKVDGFAGALLLPLIASNSLPLVPASPCLLPVLLPPFPPSSDGPPRLERDALSGAE